MEDETMNDAEKRNEERKQTPIRDGDARPDKFVETPASEINRAERKKNKDTSPVTSNRAADDDKIEDFRDAR